MTSRSRKKSNLLQHLRTPSDGKPYKCTEHSKAFSQLGHLKTYMRIHTGEIPFKCSVSECEKTFTQSSHLKEVEGANENSYRRKAFKVQRMSLHLL